jgi:hypothetical protein
VTHDSGQAGDQTELTDAVNRNRIQVEQAVSQELLRLLGNSAIELSAYSLEAIADQVVEAVLIAAKSGGSK